MRLLHIQFLIKIAENASRAMGEIIQSEKENICRSVFEEFTLFHIKASFRSSMLESQNRNDSMDVGQYLTYDLQEELVKKLLIFGTISYAKLWSIIANENPDLSAFIQLGFKIVNHNDQLIEQFEKLIKINPGAANIAFLYSRYQSLVLNDPELADHWFHK